MKFKNVKPILNILRIISAITILLIIILSNVENVVGTENVEYTSMKDINYSETLEDIKNPERGFYSTAFLKLSPSGNKATNSRANLTHLRVGIGDFSKANNGNKDLEFTEDALNVLNETLSNIKNNGGSVIIRFAYDNFNGKADVEPSLDIILTHISQLKPVFEANQDVISYVELGFFGPWGEMHTSKICTTDNVSRAIDTMLNTVPEKIKIGVRTPNYYAKWLGIDRSKLNENITDKGTKAYRVGLYNDGYLGSESDLGTFANREIEIKWLEKQAMHTLYGGEVVANYASGTPLNTAKYMSNEAFRTHTTYLNSEWNNTVINEWKNETYDGDDKLYLGQTGYTYIANHLGYRFVLRDSKVANKNGNLQIKLQVENVGFANLINDKKVTLILEKNGKTHEILTDVDATTWNSKQTSNIDIKVQLPENIELGEWNIYLRISQYGDMNKDNNYKCIQLANSDIWEESLGGNYIGKTLISEKSDTDVPNDEDKPSKPEIPVVPEDKDTPSTDVPKDEDEPSKPVTPETPEDKETPNTPDKPIESEKTNTENNSQNGTVGNNKDTTTVTGKLPKTGSNIEIIILICLVIGINIIISYIKIKKI